ncbi:MAG: hypothetical protein KIT35_14635 [Piscinibacter sp.]|uniref:hypothetical protein n=2 Tax=Piscinibacter TaxID=1114981 RepID=UPI000FDDA134|nr:hypothetical protein [Piscinibacter sp.]MCW5665063.1 hypothetical protein [Piscinibacter sp.]
MSGRQRHGTPIALAWPTDQDVVETMPLSRSTPAPVRRLRPAGPHCRGGASSLLRLAQPATPRLPKAPDLSGWISKAAGMLGVGEPRFPAFAASELSS